MLRCLLASAVMLSTVATAGAQPGVVGAEEAAVSVVRIPGGGVQARVVVGGDGAVHVVYLRGDASESDVVYARRGAGGEWATPAPVGEPGSAVASGAIRGAQIAMDGAGAIHIVWNGSGKREGAAHESGPLLYTRSMDAGKTFEAPRDLMGSTWALDGGASVAAGAGGRVAVVWHAGYQEGKHEDSARGLFVAGSEDGGASFGPGGRVEQAGSGCCACCALTAFFDPRERLNVLYRAAAGNADRDMRLLAESGGAFWATAVDAWRVDACPVTTCAAVRAGERVLIAWETRGQVWVGEVDGAGAVVRRAPARGAGGKRKHPTLAVDAGGRVLMAWALAERFGAPGEVGWQVFDRELRPVEGGAGSGADLPAWGAPAVWAGEDGFVVLY